MIENYHLNPNDSKDFGIFKEKDPRLATFMEEECKRLCRSKDVIYGRNEIKEMLSKKIPASFADFSVKYQGINLAPILGLCLKLSVFLDNENWFMQDLFDENNVFQTRMYAKLKNVR